MRCAAEAAAEDRREVTVVELATLRDPAAFTSLLARALDVQQRQYRTLDETIVEYLATRRDLLVLDNCEHLTGVVATLVDQLRASCPDLRILATSRQPLGLAGELVRVAAPLELPPIGSSTVEEVSTSAAVQLFVSRAKTAVADFELNADNAADVAEICRRLDGLPLAVELAAARLRALSVRALAERLVQRVQSLGQTQRSADGRLRSLAELVRWSYDLLEPAAQRVFEELAVFAGGFELDAVDAVCTAHDDGAVDTVDVLADLVDRSMVVVVDRRAPRYRLLEPLREFALDRLVDDGTLATVEARHLDWFLSLAEQGAAGLDTAAEAEWSDRLDRNFDNFRAAFQCATRAGDADKALRLVVALRELCFRRVHYEVAAWADAATGLPTAVAHTLHPVGLAIRGYGDWVRGDLDAAIRIAHRAVGHGDGTGGLAERVLGNAYFYKGDPVHALQWMEKMLAVARAGGNPAALAHALYMRSVAYTSLGDTVRGAVLAGEARAAADSAGSLTARAQASYALGLALEGTAPAEALEHLELAADLAAAGGNRWVEAFALTEVHWLRARGGEHVAALAGFADVVRTWSRGGDWANQWLSLRRVFGVFVDIGALEAGAVLYGSLAAVGAAHALPFEPADAQRLSGIVDELRSLLGPAAFADAVRRGASMKDTEIVEYVIDRIEQSRSRG
jgi:predicted ATPase